MFMISLIFLIFDVELMILYPAILLMKYLSWFSSIMLLWSFLIFMSMGLILEWAANKLDWSIFSNFGLLLTILSDSLSKNDVFHNLFSK